MISVLCIIMHSSKWPETKKLSICHSRYTDTVCPFFTVLYHKLPSLTLSGVSFPVLSVWISKYKVRQPEETGFKHYCTLGGFEIRLTSGTLREVLPLDVTFVLKYTKEILKNTKKKSRDRIIHFLALKTIL